MAGELPKRPEHGLIEDRLIPGPYFSASLQAWSGHRIRHEKSDLVPACGIEMQLHTTHLMLQKHLDPSRILSSLVYIQHEEPG